MSQQFRTVTTNAGRNAVREALAQGKTVKLSHMSVGDGGGSPVTPTSSMTALVNERFRAQINDIVLDPDTPDLFTAELFIPQAEGGWYIREVGLWMDDGTLFAVGNTPLTEKPDISSGATTDLLVRLIIRVLDAATVSIEIDPAQVLATREYVDRKLDAHNKDGGAHETLARKSVQIKAGTGLTGGGTLEADRTLTIKYGNTAGTACQGNDVRLADARTPKPHKATHQTGGSDAITPADIGAAAKTIQIKPGTGLTGGGTLEADRTLTVSYGTAAGTACQGNDARLSNARTPTAHKTTHKTGGTDALTPADIGAAAKTVQIKAGTGLSGGGTLENNIELSMKLDGKTTQADAGGVITVKDVAIGGKTSDLASARGQIGNNIRINTASDLNAYTTAGNWLFSDAAAEINFPTAGKGGELNCYVSTSAIFQFFTEFNNNRRYIRYGIPNSEQWSGWVQFVSVAQIGDGIRTTKGIISVPEYDGATTSTAGTGGLVPPAAAGQQDMVLTGSGKWVVPPAETFRLSMIGVPRYWRSTTLPVGHVWANGDLALFADWPELKKIYDAGGFAGMLLAYNANSATIAANLGKWRPNAANPTGLYVPNLSEQFFRACTGSGNAGGYNAPGIPNITGAWSGWNIMSIEGGGPSGAFQSHWEPNGTVALETKTAGVWDNLIIDASNSNPVYGSSQTVMPASIDVPCIIYLGLST